ncbi:MAG: chromate efflux transporter [Devosia sp.]|nr:chromate efflux transporter [Devosia sp.]
MTEANVHSERDAGDPGPRLLAVTLEFLRLGLTSFGGPVAHLGYFRQAFVVRRKWLSEQHYADIVALCQFLPGPASSQVGMAIGFERAGYLGAIGAWAAFTLPSVVLLLAFAFGLEHWAGLAPSGALHGLKVAALAVVAQAVWSMARHLAPDRPRQIVMALAAAAVLLLPSGPMQLAVMAMAALWGALLGRSGPVPPEAEGAVIAENRGVAAGLLVVFFAVLIGLPLLAGWTGNPVLRVADIFYRAGALVFGGGHLVLPLLQSQLVPTGLMARDVFLAGYGATQAVPGPLFAFAAFAGATLLAPPNGVGGAALALVAIYLPSFLLVLGVLPFWYRLRGNVRLRSALDGVNAAVVGLLVAALYDPVFTGAVGRPADLALAVLALAGLALLRLPPWLVVLLCAGAGTALG